MKIAVRSAAKPSTMPDVAPRRRALQQPANRRRHPRERVLLDHRLQAVGHRLRVDERARHERQREDQREAEVHDALRRLHHQAERAEPPREPEREHDQDREGADDAEDAAVGVIAQDQPDHQPDQSGQHVARRVGEQRPDQRRRARDRQRAEAIDHALRQVRVHRDAGVDRGEHDRHHQDPRQEVLQVLAGRPLDSAAPDEGEHQGEQDRRQRHVEQLLRNVLDLQAGRASRR